MKNAFLLAVALLPSLTRAAKIKPWASCASLLIRLADPWDRELGHSEEALVKSLDTHPQNSFSAPMLQLTNHLKATRGIPEKYGGSLSSIADYLLGRLVVFDRNEVVRSGPYAGTQPVSGKIIALNGSAPDQLFITVAHSSRREKDGSRLRQIYPVGDGKNLYFIESPEQEFAREKLSDREEEILEGIPTVHIDGTKPAKETRMRPDPIEAQDMARAGFEEAVLAAGWTKLPSFGWIDPARGRTFLEGKLIAHMTETTTVTALGQHVGRTLSSTAGKVLQVAVTVNNHRTPIFSLIILEKGGRISPLTVFPQDLYILYEGSRGPEFDQLRGNHTKLVRSLPHESLQIDDSSVDDLGKAIVRAKLERERVTKLVQSQLRNLGYEPSLVNYAEFSDPIPMLKSRYVGRIVHIVDSHYASISKGGVRLRQLNGRIVDVHVDKGPIDVDRPQEPTLVFIVLTESGVQSIALSSYDNVFSEAFRNTNGLTFGAKLNLSALILEVPE